MKRFLLILFLCGILIASPTVTAQDTQVNQPESYNSLFDPFFEEVINRDGSVDQAINTPTSLRSGIDAGLALTTLVKLYDLYGVTNFLDIASAVSDYLSTSLNDPRYPLIATYYDNDAQITSNYRSVIDNFLIAWGLSELADRIDPSQELAKNTQETRSDFVSGQLDLFDNDVGFVEQLRVDRGTESSVFTVYTNLMAAFIITESQSAIFDQYADKPAEIMDYVTQYAVTGDGGVHTLVFNGFSDELITLRNTALYANLALNLYTQTNNATYLNRANQSMQFIQQEFYDIGVTGGYFETLLDGSPVQQSKSLFSHALILQLLLRLANLGDNGARLNLLAVWRTISRYFRTADHFYSSLNRGGDPASSSITTVDNLMMIYSMSSLPLFSQANYTSDVEFRDKINILLDIQVPQNVQSNLIITVGGEEIETRQLSGQSDLQQLEIELDPIRPEDDYQSFTYHLTLSSEGVITDELSLNIQVSLAPGLDLSLGVISVFSVIGVVIFILFMRRYGEIATPIQV